MRLVKDIPMKEWDAMTDTEKSMAIDTEEKFFTAQRRASTAAKRKKNNNLPRGKNHAMYDATIYKLRNKKTGDTFTGTQQSFKAKYPNTKQSGVSQLVHGKCKSYLGWVLK